MEQQTREQELQQALEQIFAITIGDCCTELEVNRIRSICREHLQEDI